MALLDNPKLKSSSIFFILNQLIEKGLLVRVGRDTYCKADTRRNYSYVFSDELNKIVRSIEKCFPLVEFKVWESIQYNYFANHQIAHNMFFVEVEKYAENSVYEMLKDKFKFNVLLKPSLSIWETYADKNSIIIQNGKSEEPSSRDNPHLVVLEKLLVDMVADKKTRLFLEESEFPYIIEDALSLYYVDLSKLYRYARRRNVEKKIRSIIEERTI